MLRFEIKGSIVAIKNNMMMTRPGKVIKSPRLKAFERTANKQLRAQYKGQPVIRCSSIEMNFYFARQNRSDVDNKSSTICDALTRAGIISDDNYHVVPKLVLTGEYRKGNGGCVITINNPEFQHKEETK